MIHGHTLEYLQFYEKHVRWFAARVFLNNQTQWTVPNNVVAVRVWAIGGGGGGGGTKQGKNGPTSGSGGGGGALSASTFLVTPGTIIQMSIGNKGGGGNSGDAADGTNTTVNYAPQGIALNAGGGRGGIQVAGNAPGRPGGNAFGGIININGGTSGAGNNAAGSGGGGGAPGSNAAGRNPGCLSDTYDMFLALSLAGASTNYCGGNGANGGDGNIGDLGCGGGGAGKQRKNTKRGGNGGDGFVLIMWARKL